MKSVLQKFLIIMLIFTLRSQNCIAQSTETSGWFFLSHSQKCNKKWSYMTDVQLRASHKFTHLQNILIRPGLLYHMSDNHSAGIGYAYFSTWNYSEQPKKFEPENRIFEQYIVELESGSLLLNNRFRLEQRFIQKTDKNVFSQRFRHQIQATFRINADTSFKKGWYVKLQNEIFLNVKNKEKINNNFFDQNRPYIAIGYRVNKKAEIESGYYYRYQVEKESRSREHVFQLMINTDL